MPRPNHGPNHTLPERSERRKRGFEPASSLVARHLRGPMAKRGFAEAKLLTRWPEIAGAEIAAMAQPVSIRHGGKQGLGGTLILLTTGAAAPILQMRSEEIMARVNACYGYRAVSRVQITQTAASGFAEGQLAFQAAPNETPAPEPDPVALAETEKEIARIGDDRLRDALGRMARRALART